MMRKGLREFMSHSGAPAAGVLVLERDGLVDSAVAGTVHRDSPHVVELDDVWHLGSCTKSITALLVGCLVERGDVGWEQSVGTLFEDLHPHPGWHEVTLTDLLLCRGGVPPNPAPTEMRKLWADASPLQTQRTVRATKILAAAPSGPGEFSYSNLSYTLVGAVIDRVSGQDYEKVLSELVLDPLGITSAGFGPPERIHGHAPKIQIGRFFKGPGSPMSPTSSRSDNPTLLNPAGRLHLTLADWATVVQVFLNAGQPLVHKDTFDHLTTLASPDTMAMGWGNGSLLGGSLAMQGSNRMWSATALLDESFEAAVLVVANDGRDSVLDLSAQFAGAHLNEHRS